MHDEIRADYNQLEQVASQFGQQSQAIQQLLQKVQASMHKLEDRGWIGRGASAFFSEMRNEVLPASQRLQNTLDEASRVVKDISQTMKRAEHDASSRFRQQ